MSRCKGVPTKVDSECSLAYSYDLHHAPGEFTFCSNVCKLYSEMKIKTRLEIHQGPSEQALCHSTLKYKRNYLVSSCAHSTSIATCQYEQAMCLL